MNNVVAMAKVNIVDKKPSNRTSPRTCGPMHTPSTTSRTATGTRMPSGISLRSGAATAATSNQKTG